MRKKDEALKDTLLDCARAIAAGEGADAINIRRLAARAGIATGTVYNYFESKEDVLLALTEGYWRETMEEMRFAVRAERFSGQLREIILFLREKISGPGGAWMRSLSGAEAEGRERMRAVQAVLRDALVRRLERDSAIREGVWRAPFTRERYADFALRNVLWLIEADEADIDFFLGLVNRTLYD
jgi:AcrR family transcriptional regulator